MSLVLIVPSMGKRLEEMPCKVRDRYTHLLAIPYMGEYLKWAFINKDNFYHGRLNEMGVKYGIFGHVVYIMLLIYYTIVRSARAFLSPCMMGGKIVIIYVVIIRLDDSIQGHIIGKHVEVAVL